MIGGRLEAAFGAPVLEAYGMTEAAHQMTSNPLPPAKRKPGSVGRPGTDDARSASWDLAGRISLARRCGEVVIQGPNVIRGYENNPEANATSFVDGWFRTGDRGYLDHDGYQRLIARIKKSRSSAAGRRSRHGRMTRRCSAPGGCFEVACFSACRTRPGAKKSPPPSSCATR